MKIIDILNKKANGTLEDGFKFIYNYEIFTYKNEEIVDEIDRNIGCLFHLDIHLNDEVEVIEKDKQIEEINDTCSEIGIMTNEQIDFYNNATRAKINELVRAVNKIREEK